MEMIFITEDDFGIQVKDEILNLLGESGTIEKAERMAIDQVKAHISGRYDVEIIFAKTGTQRDHYIVMLIIDIILYHLWAKKAPRQIPQYRETRYKDALDWLTDVGNGSTPTALPQLSVDDFSNEVRIYSTHSANDHKF